MSPAGSSEVRSSRRSPEVEASAAADSAAWGADEVLAVSTGAIAAGKALVAVDASAGATAAAGAGVVMGCAGCAAGGAAVSAAGAEEGAGGESSPRVADANVSVRATTAPKVLKRMRCFMGGRSWGSRKGAIGSSKECGRRRRRHRRASRRGPRQTRRRHRATRRECRVR